MKGFRTGKVVIVAVLILSMILSTAPMSFGTEGNTNSQPAAEESVTESSGNDSANEEAEQNTDSTNQGTDSTNQEDVQENEQTTEEKEIVYNKDNLEIKTDDLEEKGLWLEKDSLTVSYEKDQILKFKFKGTFPKEATGDRKIEIRIPEGMVIKEKNELYNYKVEDYKDDSAGQDGKLLTYTFNSQVTSFNFDLKVNFEDDVKVGDDFVLETKGTCAAKEVTEKIIAQVKDAAAKESANTALKASRATTRGINTDSVTYSDLPDTYTMTKGKADDGWYKDFTATYTKDGVTYSYKPEGDEKTLVVRWVDENDAVVGTGIQYKAGIYKMRAKFYYTDSNGNLQELGYSNECIITVKGVNIEFTSQCLYFTKGDPDFSEDDFRKYVSCKNEQGIDVPYFVNESNNFNIDNASSYYINYFTIDPDTLEKYTAGRYAYVRDEGIYFNDKYPTDALNDNLYCSYTYSATDPAATLPADLLAKLKDYFYYENGEQVPAGQITVSDNGGYDKYDPLPSNTNSKTYRIKYEIQRHAEGEPVYKTVQVTVQKFNPGSSNDYLYLSLFNNFGNIWCNCYGNNTDLSSYISVGEGTPATKIKDVFALFEGSNDNMNYHYSASVDGKEENLSSISEIKEKFDVDIDTTNYKGDVPGTYTLPITLIWKKDAANPEKDVELYGNINVRVTEKELSGAAQILNGSNSNLTFSHYYNDTNKDSFSVNTSLYEKKVPEFMEDGYTFKKSDFNYLNLTTMNSDSKIENFNQKSETNFNEFITLDWDDTDL